MALLTTLAKKDDGGVRFASVLRTGNKKKKVVLDMANFFVKPVHGRCRLLASFDHTERRKGSKRPIDDYTSEFDAVCTWFAPL